MEHGAAAAAAADARLESGARDDALTGRDRPVQRSVMTQY